MREWAKKKKKRWIERTSKAGQEREKASCEIQWLPVPWQLCRPCRGNHAVAITPRVLSSNENIPVRVLKKRTRGGPRGAQGVVRETAPFSWTSREGAASPVII